MKLNRLGRALEIYTNSGGGKKPAKAEGVAKKKDELELSSKAKLQQFAMVELRNLPDVREEKIAAIKARVESGTYEIDAKAIAEKLVNMSKWT